MLGATLGAGIAAHYGWRMAFLVLGLPGVLLGLATYLVVDEPKRGGLDPASTAPSQARRENIWVGFRAFAADPTLRLTAAAAGLAAFVGYAFLAWNPAFMMRVKGMDLVQIATYYGLLIGITGISGTMVSGFLIDRLSKRDPRWYVWVPAIGFLLSLPFMAGYIWTADWRTALWLLAVTVILQNSYLAPAIVVVHNIVKPERRTLSTAILLFVVNLTGLGGGPLYVGMISDAWRPALGESSLMAGMAALLLIVPATVGLFVAAGRSIAKNSAFPA